jgi:hypothetical protein
MIPSAMNDRLLLPVACLAVAAACGPFLAAAEPFSEDFSAHPAGQPPDLMVLEGAFTVEAEDAGNHVLQIGPGELVDATVQLGPSLRSGGDVTVRAKGFQKRRSFPRFGVGLHGQSGFRLRVVPAARTVELTRQDEVIQSVPFAWSPGQWYFLRLRVEALDTGRWSVSGWVWPEAAAPPRDALVEYISEEARLEGKASLFGTPFSGQPVLFDDLRVTPLAPMP